MLTNDAPAARKILEKIPASKMWVADPVTAKPVEMEVVTLHLPSQGTLTGTSALFETAMLGRQHEGETGFYTAIRTALGDTDKTLVVARMGGLGFDGHNRVELNAERLREIAGFAAEPVRAR